MKEPQAHDEDLRDARYDQLRREAPDPREADNPLPALYLVFFGVMGAIGFIYLLQLSGPDFGLRGDRRSVQITEQVEETGEALFQKNCSSCHQTSGQGVPHVYPPLVQSSWLLRDKETPIRIVLMGLQGNIEVEGQTYTGAMTPFRTLSDKQIALILTHERSSWGNQAPAVSEPEVAAVRKSLADRTAPWNGGEELSKVRTGGP